MIHARRLDFGIIPKLIYRYWTKKGGKKKKKEKPLIESKSATEKYRFDVHINAYVGLNVFLLQHWSNKRTIILKSIAWGATRRV